MIGRQLSTTCVNFSFDFRWLGELGGVGLICFPQLSHDTIVQKNDRTKPLNIRTRISEIPMEISLFPSFISYLAVIEKMVMWELGCTLNPQTDKYSVGKWIKKSKTVTWTENRCLD